MLTPVGGANRHRVARVVDRDDLAARFDFDAGSERGGLQTARQCAHPTNRQVPRPTDHVVEEAAVLLQPRIGQRGEGADQRVGADDPAAQIVIESGVQQFGERLFEQLVLHRAWCQRSGQRSEQLGRQLLGSGQRQLAAVQESAIAERGV